MKNLLILGARGFGREVESIAKRDPGYGSQFRLKGFLDSDAHVLDGMGSDLPICGTPESYVIEPGDCFVCALGSPVNRLKYANMIADRGGEFINLIDRSSVVNEGVKLGRGIIVQNHCIISSDTKLGDYSVVQSFTAVGHDAVVGEAAHISAYVFLGGASEVGSCAQIWTRSSVFPEVKIGAHAVVGAHSLCNRDVEPFTTVFGTPARPKMKKTNDE